MEWVKLAIPIPQHDFVQQIKLKHKKLCLIRHQSRLFVVQHSCPHAGGMLGGGWCKEGKIVCPIHRYAYDLDTGRGAKGQGDYINIYATELREDGLYVGFEESWWSRLWG